MKYCSFLRQRRSFLELSWPSRPQTWRAANPLLQPLGPLCQTLPKLMHKLLTATEIIEASVSHCGCWSLSLSAAVQALAQWAGWARRSIILHSAPAIIYQHCQQLPACFHPPELSLLTLLDYIRWHNSHHQHGEMVTRCDLHSSLMFSFLQPSK